MPNSSIATIRAGLDTQLSAVAEIKQVEIGRTQKFDAFPACRFYLAGIGDQTETTAENYRSYIFSIDVIHPVSIDGVTLESGESDFQDAVDAVMDKLDSQWMLGGIEHSLISQGTVRYEEVAQGPALVMPFLWQARVLISI